MSKRTTILRLFLVFSAVFVLVGAIFGAVLVAPSLIFKSGLHTLDGQKVESPADLLPEDAQVGYIVYFRTDCSACMKEMHELEKLAASGNKRIGVVAVNVRESFYTVDKFLQEEEIQTWAGFPILLGHDGSGIEAFPFVTVWMQKDGEWEAVGSNAQYYTAEELMITAYVFLYQESQITFYEGQLKVDQWLWHEGHTLVIVKQTGDNLDYNVTHEDLHSMCADLLWMANLEHDQALFVVYVIENQAYGFPLLSQLLYTTGANSEGFFEAAHDTQGDVAAILQSYWNYMDLNYFYAITGLPPYYLSLDSAWGWAYAAASYEGWSFAPLFVDHWQAHVALWEETLANQ